MGFFGTRNIGLVEKACSIATKHNVTFSPKSQTFIGPPAVVAIATKELKTWTYQQAQRVRREA